MSASPEAHRIWDLGDGLFCTATAFAGLVAPRAVFTDSGMCKARFAFAPFGCRQAQDACYLGRYGPEGQLRARRRYSSGLCLAGVGGVCTSCCVPFFRRQAQEALHHGRSRPEGQVCSVEDRDDSTFAARRVATTGLMVQTV